MLITLGHNVDRRVSLHVTGNSNLFHQRNVWKRRLGLNTT